MVTGICVREPKRNERVLVEPSYREIKIVGTKHDRVTRRENTRASGNKGRTHRHHQHHHDIRSTPDVGRQLLECKAPAPGMRLQQREVVWFLADGVLF